MLSNKLIILTGIYNKNSISYHILKQLINQNAKIICLVKDENIKNKVKVLIDKNIENKNQILDIYPYDFSLENNNLLDLSIFLFINRK